MLSSSPPDPAEWRIVSQTGLRFLLALLLSVGTLASGLGTETALAAPVDQMIQGVNEVRREAGLWPLSEDPALDAVAAERSADMVSRRYFSHYTPDGRTVFDLLDDRGVGFRAAGENLAWNTGRDDRASSFALQGFMNSPSHRANILKVRYSRIGVGVARFGSITYLTVVFVG